MSGVGVGAPVARRPHRTRRHSVSVPPDLRARAPQRANDRLLCCFSADLDVPQIARLGAGELDGATHGEPGGASRERS